VSLKLIPSSKLLNQEYNSKLVVLMGSEKISKNILTRFNPINFKPVEFSVLKEVLKETSELKQFKLRVLLKNNSLKEFNVEFLGIENLPSDWSFLIKTSKVRLKPLATKELEVLIEGKSFFKDKVFLEFEFNGFTEKIPIELVFEKKGFSINDFTGFASFIQANAKRILIDLVLIFIASILLIAFIARLVKRIYAVKK
jgi:hypothetical protein